MSRLARLVVLATGTAAVAFAPALARDLTVQERTALTEMADRYEAAMKDGRGDLVAAVLPPRMLEWIGKQSGVSPESVLSSTAKQIDNLKEAGIRMTVTLDLAHADFESLKDGTPYVVIPTHGVVDIPTQGAADGPKHKAIEIDSLALMEDGRWYLLDISSEARLERLRQAFPEFDGVTFDSPATTTKP